MTATELLPSAVNNREVLAGMKPQAADNTTKYQPTFSEESVLYALATCSP